MATTTGRIPLDNDASPFNRAQARGHLIRTGHVLAGYFLPTGDQGIVRLIRTCCKENNHE